MLTCSAAMAGKNLITDRAAFNAHQTDTTWQKVYDECRYPRDDMGSGSPYVDEAKRVVKFRWYRFVVNGSLERLIQRPRLCMRVLGTRYWPTSFEMD